MKLKMKYKMMINGNIMIINQILNRKLVKIIQNRIRVFKYINRQFSLNHYRELGLKHQKIQYYLKY